MRVLRFQRLGNFDGLVSLRSANSFEDRTSFCAKQDRLYSLLIHETWAFQGGSQSATDFHFFYIAMWRHSFFEGWLAANDLLCARPLYHNLGLTGFVGVA